MTARQLQLLCRDVAIWCARRGGMRLDMIARAFALSVRRIRQILRRLSDPKEQNASFQKIHDGLKTKGSTPLGGRRGFTPRAAPL